MSQVSLDTMAPACVFLAQAIHAQDSDSPSNPQAAQADSPEFPQSNQVPVQVYLGVYVIQYERAREWLNSRPEFEGKPISKGGPVVDKIEGFLPEELPLHVPILEDDDGNDLVWVATEAVILRGQRLRL